MYTISIVGMGAVGVSTLYNFLEIISTVKKENKIRFLVFEKGQEIGPGLAYSDSSLSSILNQTSHSMSIQSQNSYDFCDWIAKNKKKLRNIFSLADLAPQGNPPRNLFGMYLKEKYLECLKKAKNQGIEIFEYKNEVIDMDLENGISLILENYREKLKCDYVVICTGNVHPSNYKKLIDNPQYFNSPYDTSQLKSNIPSKAKIGIIGARLSAIDASLALLENRHEGPITFLTQSSFLPTVYSKQTSHNLSKETRNKISSLLSENPKSLTLKKIFKIILYEIRKIDNSFKVTTIRKKYTNPINAFIAETIDSIKGEKKFQSVLISFNHFIEYFWYYLKEEEKLRALKFFHNYQSFRVSVPLKNALKLSDYFLQGKLKLMSQLENIEYNFCKNYFTASFKDHKLIENYDAIINASGFYGHNQNIDSKLIQNLLNKKNIIPSPYGGVKVDFHTNAVETINTKIKNHIFCIGNITHGTYLFTSILELNVIHSERVASFIANQITRTEERFIKNIS